MWFLIFDARNLTAEPLYAFKSCSGRNRVDEEETFAFANPLISERRVFFLTSGVEHFEHAWLIIDDGLFAIRIFDGGIVGLDEMIETELDGQSGLSYTSISEHDELVDHHFATHFGQVVEQRSLEPRIAMRVEDEGKSGSERGSAEDGEQIESAGSGEWCSESDAGRDSAR